MRGLNFLRLLGRLTALLLALAAAFFAPASAGTPAAGAKPVIVYIETNPWLMVIGSDSPQLVLYDDGTVIYLTKDGYRSASLSPAERAAFEAKVSLQGIEPYINFAPNVSDQPESIIIDLQSAKAVGAYGAVSSFRDPATNEQPLLRLITFLRDYQMPGARPWEPEVIEVMIWPYEYAPDPSIVWPKEWPGLDHPSTVRRDDLYSLYLPGREKDALISFLKTQKERGAVEIAGKKWAASLRLPLPGEATWTKIMHAQPESKD